MISSVFTPVLWKTKICLFEVRCYTYKTVWDWGIVEYILQLLLLVFLLHKSHLLCIRYHDIVCTCWSYLGRIGLIYFCVPSWYIWDPKVLLDSSLHMVVCLVVLCLKVDNSLVPPVWCFCACLIWDNLLSIYLILYIVFVSML